MNSQETPSNESVEDAVEEKYPKPNRTIKDSVFKALFSEEKYLRDLIVTLLGPERADNQIVDTTLSNILASGGFFNDLSFCLEEKGKKDCVVLVEAQSTWDIGIVYRVGNYYFHVMERYFSDKNEDIYHLTESKIPDSALFIIFTGKDTKLPAVSFRENLMHNPNYPVDVNVKVITLENAAGILKEYILFCQILDEKKKGPILTIQEIREVVEECIEKGILKDFLLSHRSEVIQVLESMLNQEIVTRNEILRNRREATEIAEKKAEEAAKIAEKKAEEKTAQKVAETRSQTAISMLSAGVPDENILAWSGISKQELDELKNKLAKEKQNQPS